MSILYAGVFFCVMAIAACEIILTISLLRKNPRIPARTSGKWMMIMLMVLMVLVAVLTRIGGQ